MFFPLSKVLAGQRARIQCQLASKAGGIEVCALRNQQMVVVRLVYFDCSFFNVAFE